MTTSGVKAFAINSPTPVYCTSATKILTNAMNGIIVFNNRSTVFLPESKNMETTEPTPEPILVNSLNIRLPLSSAARCLSTFFGCFSISGSTTAACS